MIRQISFHTLCLSAEQQRQYHQEKHCIVLSLMQHHQSHQCVTSVYSNDGTRKAHLFSQLCFLVTDCQRKNKHKNISSIISSQSPLAPVNNCWKELKSLLRKQF